MKKLAIAFAVFAFILGIVCYNIWRAYQDPIVTTPGPLEIGRQHLQQQLLDSEKREAEIEQADWGSITLLEDLIKAHQTRIEKLNGNTQAGDILAHDKDAIARIQKRIADLQQQQRALPASEPGAEDATASQSAPPANDGTKPAPSSPQDQSIHTSPHGTAPHTPNPPNKSSGKPSPNPHLAPQP